MEIELWMAEVHSAKGKSEHRTDQLIDAHLLRTEGAGEENPVKKADNAAENSGGSQQKSALQQMILYMAKNVPGILTEVYAQEQGDRTAPAVPPYVWIKKRHHAYRCEKLQYA